MIGDAFVIVAKVAFTVLGAGFLAVIVIGALVDVMNAVNDTLKRITWRK